MSSKDNDEDSGEWSRRVEKANRAASKKDGDVTMPKGNNGDRYVVKHNDGWAVKKENAVHASGVFRTQKEAIDRAREIVDKTSGGNGEVRIQGRDGKWRDSDSGKNNESEAQDTK